MSTQNEMAGFVETMGITCQKLPEEKRYQQTLQHWVFTCVWTNLKVRLTHFQSQDN